MLERVGGRAGPESNENLSLGALELESGCGHSQLAAVTDFYKQWLKTTLRLFSGGAGGHERGREGCHLLEALGENTFPLCFQLLVAPALLGFPPLPPSPTLTSDL